MDRLPLHSGPRITVAGWPAALAAGRLLESLGAAVLFDDKATEAVRCAGTAVHRAPTSAAEDWARSGAMTLTGFGDQAPLHPVGRPASVMAGAAIALELLTGLAVDGPALLGERAALSGLRRNGQVSPGGGTRLLRATDGWCAINLARDRELVPALTESAGDTDPWHELGAWARETTLSGIVERATMLGMAAGALGETPSPAAPWRIRRKPASDSGTRDGRPLLVLNFGALWAAPLAANLLNLSGMRVIDVKSTSRPDPSRHSSPAFYARLHDGQEQRMLDFTDRRSLHDLVSSADVVIEASRPRAFADLGISAGEIMADGRARTWLRITGHPDPARVAFGDDAAVAGGLVAFDDGRPVFAADAIADPITGLLGALAVAACTPTHDSTLIEMSLARCAAYCVRGAGGERPAWRSGETSYQVADAHVARREPRRP